MNSLKIIYLLNWYFLFNDNQFESILIVLINIYIFGKLHTNIFIITLKTRRIFKKYISLNISFGTCYLNLWSKLSFSLLYKLSVECFLTIFYQSIVVLFNLLFLRFLTPKTLPFYDGHVTFTLVLLKTYIF